MECSAKSNNNIEAAFQKLATDLVNCKETGEGQNDNADKKKSSIKLLTQNIVSQFNGCC
jgi:hypothetical protein